MDCVFFLQCEEPEPRKFGPMRVRDTSEAKRLAAHLLRMNEGATAVDVWEGDGSLYRVAGPVNVQRVIALQQ